MPKYQEMQQVQLSKLENKDFNRQTAQIIGNARIKKCVVRYPVLIKCGEIGKKGFVNEKNIKKAKVCDKKRLLNV